jgi:macrolide transport system ATP-binding/permease protein
VCLEEALADCPCAMLLVSHDEAFLAKMTETRWSLTRDASGDTRLAVAG